MAELVQDADGFYEIDRSKHDPIDLLRDVAGVDAPAFRGPSWSPDDRHMVFHLNGRGQHRGIFTLNVDADDSAYGTLTRLKRGPGVWSPSWRRDAPESAPE